MPTSPGYPVQLLLSGRPVLVVGGGAVAARKAEALVAAGADVTVVAPRVSEAVAGLGVRIERREYEPADVAGRWLVVVATDDPAVGEAVARDAERERVFVNVADDPGRCTATLPAVARRGPITVAVATAGHSPLLAQALRDRCSQLLDDGVVRLAEALARFRQIAQEAGRSTETVDWEEVLGGDLVAILADGRASEAAQAVERTLDPTTGE